MIQKCVIFLSKNKKLWDVGYKLSAGILNESVIIYFLLIFPRINPIINKTYAKIKLKHVSSDDKDTYYHRKPGAVRNREEIRRNTQARGNAQAKTLPVACVSPK